MCYKNKNCAYPQPILKKRTDPQFSKKYPASATPLTPHPHSTDKLLAEPTTYYLSISEDMTDMTTINGKTAVMSLSLTEAGGDPHTLTSGS